MPVTFVLGRSGSGKTHYCFERIVSAMRELPIGPSIYWILPRQATFDAERDLTCRSGLDGFCRARVVSFDQLGRDIFEECGGSSIPQVSALGRQMVIGHLLRALRPQLQCFGDAADRPGLPAQLDLTFAELERGGDAAGQLNRLLNELQQQEQQGPDDTAWLAAKLADLKLIHDAYQRFLGQERLDQHRRAREVLERLEQCSALRDADVYIDGFTDFAFNERQTLLGLARVSRHVHLTLCLDPDSPMVANPHRLPDELSLFHTTEQAYRKLWIAFSEAGVTLTDPVLLREPRRFAHPSLAFLESAFFRDNAAPCDDAEAIERIEAPDLRGEADAVATRVKRLLVEGYRLREIAILSRDLARERSALTASLAEHGLPFFLDLRRSASHHPLLRVVGALLQIARFDWPTDAVMAIFKSGLTDVQNVEAEIIENAMLEHGQRGRRAWLEQPPPWLAALEASRAHDDSVGGSRAAQRVIEAIEPLIRFLAAGEALTVRAVASAIFAALERLGVRRRLDQWIEQSRAEGRLEDAAEHEQVWNQFVSLFSQMVDLLGEQRIGLDDFAGILNNAIERFDLALTPPTVDQLLVGQIDRTRGSGLRAVVVMGLSDGIFPSLLQERSILSDRERRELQRRNLSLDPDTRRRALDERWLAYLAFTRASERLIVTRPTADNQRLGNAPSIFWQRLGELFPRSRVMTSVKGRETDFKSIWTARELVERLLRWVTRPAESDATATRTLASLYQWLATRELAGDAVDRVRSGAWKSLSYTNAASLSAAMVAELRVTPLTLSPSELEAFAECPFRHFLSYRLKLERPKPAGVSKWDLRRVYSAVLEKLVDGSIRAARRNQTDISFEPDLIHHRLRDLDEAILAGLERAGPKGQYLRRHGVKVLEEFLAGQNQVLRRTRFRPAGTLIRFGHGGQLPALSLATESGTPVRLHGAIDRLDVVGSKQSGCVIDYGLDASAIRYDHVLYGMSLKLILSLLVVSEQGQAIAGHAVEPVAALRTPITRKVKKVEHPDKVSEDAMDAGKSRGLFAASACGDLDAGCGPKSDSPILALRFNKDGSLGKRSSTDVLDDAEFQAVLAYAWRMVRKLAGQIAEGRIDIAPYRMGKDSPCPLCDFKSVCRFHISSNRYDHRRTYGKEDALQLMAEELR